MFWLRGNRPARVQLELRVPLNKNNIIIWVKFVGSDMPDEDLLENNYGSLLANSVVFVSAHMS